jgi:hypothetical protein
VGTAVGSSVRDGEGGGVEIVCEAVVFVIVVGETVVGTAVGVIVVSRGVGVFLIVGPVDAESGGRVVDDNVGVVRGEVAF